MKTETMQKRIEYFDFLRVFASFAVIMIHIVGQNWYSIKINSFAWQIFTAFDSISCWAVPIFLMISGALFLDPSRNLTGKLKKNILRIATSFVFWSALYASISYFTKETTLSETIEAFFIGHFHLWYLYIIFGLYLAVPILRKVTESESVMKYFLILSLVFSSLIPQIADIIGVLSDAGQALVVDMLDQLDLTTVSMHAFYFVLGYYLCNTEIAPKWRTWIYLLGIAGALATFILTSAVSLLKQIPWEFFLKNDSANVICMSAAIFVYAKYHFSFRGMSEKAIALLQTLSKYSFGAYLVHMLVIDLLENVFHLHTMSFHPLLSVPVIWLITFCASFAISGILNHTPVLKKYIV